MQRAIAAAAAVRTSTAPNPWVGAAIVTHAGDVSTGATHPHGGAHAEVDALRRAGDVAGAVLATTLEPCNHQGLTGPCTEAIIEAGISRVLIGMIDPDPQVAGTGIERLQDAGVSVEVGVCETEVRDQLAPYIHHRTTGRPYVLVKVAMTADGRTAAPDTTSQWITDKAARVDSHNLRAESQAILVGAGTVRSDDPTLTTRFVEGPSPRRIVLGSAPADAKIHPCLEWRGELGDLLDQLGDDGVLQLMVEGGSSTLAQFHAENLINRYVMYVAPAMLGGDDGMPVFVGAGAPTIADIRRGRFVDVRRIGGDVRLDVVLD